MDAEVYLKASELMKAIANCSEAVELKKIEQEIRRDQVANSLTQRWQKVYERVTELQNNGQALTEQDERSIEFIEAQVENHPLILDFISAHHRFTDMLEEIGGILSGALTLDSGDHGDSCSSCPSSGKCGHSGDNP